MRARTIGSGVPLLLALALAGCVEPPVGGGHQVIPGATPEPVDEPPAEGAVPRWNIAVAPDDFDRIQQDHWVEEYIPVNLHVDGEVYGPAEMRLYGGSSRARPKKSFRIRFPEGADHPGYARKINLRAEYNDPSFLRTYLGYETFRRLATVPTPRARFLEVTVNGEYHGLMLEVERIGGRFLTENGRDRDLGLYEAQQDWPSGSLTPLPVRKAWEFVYDKKSGDPDDWSDIKELVEGCLWEDYQATPFGEPTTLEHTTPAFDVEGYVDYMAIMTLLQNNDHITNNFYLSRQAVDGNLPRWEVYPFDVDLTFGCKWDPVDGTMCTEFSWETWWLNGLIPDPDADYCWCNLAMHLVLNNPPMRQRYEDRICEFTESAWWTDELHTLVDELAVQLADSVAADVNDLNDGVEGWEVSRQEITDFTALRAGFLRDNLGCDSVP